MKAVRRSRTSFWINVVLKNFSLQRNFQGLLSIVQLSRFFLCSVSSDSFYILSKALSFVKNFFIFLPTAQATALIDYHIAVRLSTTFFTFCFSPPRSQISSFVVFRYPSFPVSILWLFRLRVSKSLSLYFE